MPASDGGDGSEVRKKSQIVSYPLSFFVSL